MGHALRVTWVLGMLSALTLSCARTGFYTQAEELSPCWPDCAGTNWGDFAATLDVPDCPSSNPVLTVDTTADELNGGQSITDPSQAGDYLSFAEAIWIAANRGTPHNIFFDADVFPAATPGAIHVRDYPEMPIAGSGLCIDGRRRGVVVEYDDTLVSVEACSFGIGCDIPLRDGSLLVGLTLDNLPDSLRPSASQLAGCRLQANGLAVTPGLDFVVGPGNVFEASVALDVRNASDSGEIVRNYFGYDPLTHELLDMNVAVFAFGAVEVRQNIFGSVGFVLQLTLTGPGSPMMVRDNYFGVDEYGDSLPAGATGLSVAGSATAGRLQLGPVNTIRGTDGNAIWLLGPTLLPAITRNAISGNGGGIVYDSGAPVTAPVVTAVTGTAITGTCGVGGTVEVFSDPGDQGETFLGDAVCDGSLTWNRAASAPRGRNVTATLTNTSGVTSPFSAPFAVP